MSIVRIFFVLTIFTCCSFTQHPWQHESAGPCPDSILEFFYPDQNACKLNESIPSELRHLCYGIYPISKGYDTARFNFNKRFNIFPQMIAAPRTEKEAAHVLKLLKKHSIDFSIRSGGHCLEPGSLSRGCIIDLRNFNTLKPDVEKKEVYIGAGCRLGTVIETLGKLDYAIPTGTCASVGSAGLALGGGLGVLGRVFGPTCDSIKSLRVLTAEAKVIEVSRNKHPELFWALCGAGNGSYGIVLGITFKMHHISKVSALTLNWEWDRHTVPKIIEAWQSWITTLPENITTQLHLTYLDHTLAISIFGLKVGEKPFTEWEKPFRHLNPKVMIKKQSYLDSATEWADRAPFAFLKGKSTILMEPLTHEPIEMSLHFFEDLKKENENVYALFEFEAFGGKIPKGDTAFFPRQAFGWWYRVLYWNAPDQESHALHKLRDFQDDIAPYVSKYAYANIVDYDLGKDYLEAYYGNHVDRLIKIKNKYDPENLFHWKQSIPLERF